MQNGAMKSSKKKGRGGIRASEGSSRGMGGGQTTLEINRPPQGKMEKGRGRGFRVEGKRPTVLHTQPQDDMDGFSRHALILAKQDALLTYTARLCQEKWDSFCTALDYGPPPLAAEPERPPKDIPTASEDQPNRVHLTLQGALDHHHTAEDHWNPTCPEPPSGTRLEPVGDTTSGPLQDHPDQPNRVPSTLQGALPLPEPEATINQPPNMYGFLGQELAGGTESTTSVPLEASMEPPTQPEGDDTSTPTDNHNRGSPGRKGHNVDGSDADSLKNNSIHSEPNSRTDSLPYAALHQPTSPIVIEEWPQLPGPDAQVLHGPARKSRAMPRKEPADTPMVLPMAMNQAQKQQDTAIHSAEPDISEVTGLANGTAELITSDTATNAPPVGQSTTANPTLTRRQRSAKRPSKSGTACFSWDTYVLVESSSIR